MAENLIANGDFETSTSGKFDSWNYTPGTTGGAVAGASSSPTVIGGAHSALCYAGSSTGGRLWQVFSAEGFSDFQVDFDFAVLPDTTGSRTFSLLFFGNVVDPTGANVQQTLRVNGASSNRLEWNSWTTTSEHASGWISTGFYANATTDINGDKAFDDGESPVVNHLTIVGKNYATKGVTKVTLNGSSYSYTDSGQNAAVKSIGFYGQGCSAHFLVDNVVVSVPEPSAITIVLTGICGLLAYAWRKRK
jgi:hypothetical protein